MKKNNSENRIQSIDILRGIVMILMVLDHVRTYWNGGSAIDPTDLTKAEPILFFTRWITHFCAPVFILLTGLSAYLSKARTGKSHGEMGKSLFRRGCLLILVELILISPVWGHFPFINGVVLQVIWAIGVSMILLSLLQYLPSGIIGWAGFILIVLHNLIPPLSTTHIIPGLLGSILHQKSVFLLSSRFELVVLYPLIPWMGVMAMGYGMGKVYTRDTVSRKRFLFRSGILFILLFIAFRLNNAYGDPRPFLSGDSWIMTLMSFLNLEKYPPSFLYLMMTLGPSLLLLYLLDGVELKSTNPLLVFGRTPLFFYIIHLYLILAIAIICLLVLGIISDKSGNYAIPFGFDLSITFLIWPIVIALLYPLCFYYYKRKFL